MRSLSFSGEIFRHHLQRRRYLGRSIGVYTGRNGNYNIATRLTTDRGLDYRHNSPTWIIVSVVALVDKCVCCGRRLVGGVWLRILLFHDGVFDWHDFSQRFARMHYSCFPPHWFLLGHICGTVQLPE
ncbi:hypothetical protein BDP55DRAFT_150027 [Colletotrichum godetiae]|uniref:Uncharacterized protein n=1 Tax=Colletotrichum godetiae TaxID=1209918 RepID=A0AAJ0ET42_9PEZI|nr:uncharacterized protein BDP55DRAFT_150027 [Colletotrichum godetiae]KAK1675786.1 hypothetical protein BDP55DRAFT_150027 [Colletotrichum godetiae]